MPEKLGYTFSSFTFIFDIITIGKIIISIRSNSEIFSCSLWEK